MVLIFPMPIRQLFIDGEWRELILKKRIPIANPTSEEITCIHFSPNTTQFDWMNDFLGDSPAASTEELRLQLMLLEEHFQGLMGKIGLKHQELFMLSIYLLLLLRLQRERLI